MGMIFNKCECGIQYHIRLFGNSKDGYFVMCEDCKASTKLYPTSDGSVLAWNSGKRN